MLVKESLRFIGIPLRKERGPITDGDGVTLYSPGKNGHLGVYIEVGAQHVFVRNITSHAGVSDSPQRRIQLPEPDYVYRHKTRLPGLYHLFKRVK